MRGMPCVAPALAISKVPHSINDDTNRKEPINMKPAMTITMKQLLISGFGLGLLASNTVLAQATPTVPRNDPPPYCIRNESAEQGNGYDEITYFIRDVYRSTPTPGNCPPPTVGTVWFPPVYDEDSITVFQHATTPVTPYMYCTVEDNVVSCIADPVSSTTTLTYNWSVTGGIQMLKYPFEPRKVKVSCVGSGATGTIQLSVSKPANDLVQVVSKPVTCSVVNLISKR